VSGAIAAPRAPWRGALVYQLQRARYEPTVALGAVLLVVLAYLVVVPIGAILSDAVRVQPGDEARTGQPAGHVTAYYLWRAFGSPVSRLLLWRPLLNTCVVAIGVTLLALILGGVLAWLVVRTDLPGRKWLAPLLVVPYMMPSWTFALAWLTVFKNRAVGGPAGFLETMGISPPNWLAYGTVPIVVTLGGHYFPFAFLLLGNALRRFDSQLEESASVLGATRWTTTRRIVVPLMLPAVASAAVLTASRVLGTFGTPYILGLPVNYSVLSTSLYQSLRGGSTGVMAVLSAVIIAIGVAIVAVDSWLLREQRRFVTVGSKGAMHRRTRLRRWRIPAAALAGAAVGATVVIPLGTLTLSTIMRVPGRFEPGNFTAEFWIASRLPAFVGYPTGLLRGPGLAAAAWNSFRIVGLAALLSGALGLFVGYLAVRTQGTRLSILLRQASFLPYLVPGIAFAAAYLSLFAVRRGPIPALYGTLSLLVLALTVAYLPFASRAGIAAMMQLGREPEEAAQVCGARWWQRLWRIVAPIQRGALAAAMILPFIAGLKELSMIIMLATPGTDVLTTLSIRLQDYGYPQLANAAVLVIVALSFVVTYLGQRITGTSLASGLEG